MCAFTRRNRAEEQRKMEEVEKRCKAEGLQWRKDQAERLAGLAELIDPERLSTTLNLLKLMDKTGLSLEELGPVIKRMLRE